MGFGWDEEAPTGFQDADLELAEYHAQADEAATAPCDDCGKRVRVPDDWPVDWAYCAECKAKPDEDRLSTR
jgi:hypothetical protein